MVKVFNFQQLKKLTTIGLLTLVTVGSFGIQAENAEAAKKKPAAPNLPFKFSDFTFKRAASNQTTFHTTTYANGKKGVAAFEQFVQGESIAVKMEDLNARKLDPTKLKLIQDYGVKIYFIDEGAGYRNQLKLDTVHATNNTANAKDGMIFYDGSVGTGSEQLIKGDYVELGTIPHGSSLDFQLRANGYLPSPTSLSDPNANVWYADIAKNVDGIQHVMAFEYGGYLILAFEDLYNGGDKDYNDIVFAIDIGATNLAQIPSSPDTNLAPVAVDDAPTTPYNTAATIDVMSNDSDPENQGLTLSSLNSVSSDASGTSITTNSGTASISGGKVVYTPNEEFSGTDSFTYTVTDNQGVTDNATVTVTVEAASCQQNNGHGNNAPVTYDLGSGVKIQISQYDPSNPSGQQTSSLKAALAQGLIGKVGKGNGANTSSIAMVSGSSYSMTAEDAEALVNNYPDWEMNKDGSILNCSDSGITPGSEIVITPPEEEPGDDEPGGDEPGGDEPGGDEPGGDEPGGDEPGGDEPGGDEPGGDEPGGDEPGGDEPGGDEPGGDEPGEEEPGEEEPGKKPDGGKKSNVTCENGKCTMPDPENPGSTIEIFVD